MIKIMNQLKKANRPVIIKHEEMPTVSTLIHFGCDLFGSMTSADYSRQLKDLPMAKIGEKTSFIKPKPLENEPSRFFGKSKRNYRK